MPKLRIERIIEVKEKLLNDKKNEMESVTAEIERIIDGIHEADNNIEMNYSTITGTLMNGNDFFTIKEYITHIENKKYDMISQKENLTMRVNIIRKELVEMIKELKMLEILKSKELQNIKKSQKRRDQKMLDEMASRIEEGR